MIDEHKNTLPDFKVGDWVVVQNFDNSYNYWNGVEGEVINVGNGGYVDIWNENDLKFKPSWKGGFQSRYLRLIKSEYAQAIEILGEDYFQ
jgi:hypothetical protein